MRTTRRKARHGLLLLLLGGAAVALAAGFGGHPWWRVGPMVFNEPSLLVGAHMDPLVHRHFFLDDHETPAGADVTVDVDVTVTNFVVPVPGAGAPQAPGGPGFVFIPATNVEVSVETDP